MSREINRCAWGTSYPRDPCLILLPENAPKEIGAANKADLLSLLPFLLLLRRGSFLNPSSHCLSLSQSTKEMENGIIWNNMEYITLLSFQSFKLFGFNFFVCLLYVYTTPGSRTTSEVTIICLFGYGSKFGVSNNSSLINASINSWFICQITTGKAWKAVAD